MNSLPSLDPRFPKRFNPCPAVMVEKIDASVVVNPYQYRFFKSGSDYFKRYSGDGYRKKGRKTTSDLALGICGIFQVFLWVCHEF